MFIKRFVNWREELPCRFFVRNKYENSPCRIPLGRAFFEGGMDLRTVYTGCQVFKDACLQYADISVQNGIVDAIGEVSVKEADTVVSLSGK